MLQRMDKLLSGQGVATRSEAGRLCRQGRVTVDGVPFLNAAQKVDPDTQTIAVDGTPLNCKQNLYIMLHKPQGVLSASRDPHAPTVLDLLPDHLRRRGLFPAGRLDKDTTGFVLITDDGPLAHRLLAPKSHVEKRYRAKLDKPWDERLPALFAAGVTLEDGDTCAPSKCLLLEDGDNPWAEITLTEGKYHQIKRMFGVFGYNILRLHRFSIGGVLLDDALKEGDCRELTAKELALLGKK